MTPYEKQRQQYQSKGGSLAEERTPDRMALAERRSLARELARVYNRLVESAMLTGSNTRQQAQQDIGEILSAVTLEDVLAQDVEEVSWIDLDCLAESGEASAAWDLVKAAAQEEENLGVAAAKTIEGYGATPWQRAEFFALRKGLLDEWQPRGGMEQQLIDSLALSLYMCRFWLHQHAVRATTRAEVQKDALKKHGKRRPTFSWELEDTERAAEMADRFHRMAMRTIRALRDVRRFAPSVSIRNAEQVNIGEKQVNVRTSGS